MKPELDDSNPRYQALLDLLRTADRVWNASRAFFARWELSPSQFNVLNLLRAESEGLSQTDLSRHLIMHRSNLTGLVDRLEQRGLVERREMAGDRRAYRVVISLEGTRLLRDILPLYYEAAIQAWDGLTMQQVAAVAATLNRVASNAEALARAHAHPPPS
jgi:DNA-binding MarR family transcriptional regulator